MLTKHLLIVLSLFPTTALAQTRITTAHPSNRKLLPRSIAFSMLNIQSN